MGFPHQGEFAVHSVGVIHLGNGGGEVVFASQQNVFGTAGEVSFVLLRERGYGEGVPAEGVGVAKVGFEFTADRGDSDPVQLRGDQCHVPEGA
jgi:hypothetical protein